MPLTSQRAVSGTVAPALRAPWEGRVRKVTVSLHAQPDMVTGVKT